MSDKLLIHIPHSSLNFPKLFLTHVNDLEKINSENIFISDHLIDKFIPDGDVNIIKFNYSRLFCDVERFKNDSDEPMSKYGMVSVYYLDSNGYKFIDYDEAYKREVICNYYDNHHKKLDDMVTDILNKNNICYILDLHSFSDLFVKKIFNYDDNPDICIGVEDEKTDLELLNITMDHFKEYNYSVKINFPYKGSIIPNKYYSVNDNRIKTMMIEVNKRLYLENNCMLDKKKYKNFKKCMDLYYIKLNDYLQKNK